MCIANNDLSNPRRRHRAAYLAPARTIPFGNTATAAAETAMAFPAFDPMQESMNSSFDNMEQREQQQEKTITSILCVIYRGILDLIVLLVMTIVGLFLYDVEIKIVNNISNGLQQQQINGARGIRMVRNEMEAAPLSNSGLLPRRGLLPDTIV